MRRLPVLPSMPCDDGCGECCGPVPATPAELNAIRAYAKEHAIVPKLQGLTCPFYDGNRCGIYPVRPTLCQAFGHTAELRCHRGYGDKTLRDSRLRVILKEQGKGHKLLHSLVHELGGA